jgi:predicted transcriptional regulator
MLKALGNPIRFQIVEFLAQKKECITAEIVEATPLAQSTISQHLKVLREAGLIRGEIGGPATSDGNVISGNTDSGLVIQGSRVIVQGNYIGLSPSSPEPLRKREWTILL